MQMQQPAHPGEILKELYLLPLNLTVTETAAALGVTRKSFSSLLNGRSGVSTVMALRLSKAFNTTAELWLNMQTNYDLWQERKKRNLTRVRVLV